VSTLTDAQKTVLAFLRDCGEEFVIQEAICDHVTQCGQQPMEALEKLNNSGAIIRNPEKGREWGLSRDGREMAAQVPESVVVESRRRRRA
jgi:hypothetical protein